MMSREQGSVTAEFATAMPAVVLVLALCLSAGQLVSRQLSLQDAAAAAARSVSRGESPAMVTQRIRQLAPLATASRTERGGVSCITLEAPTPLGPAQLTLSATGCALSEPAW
jgi:Flp pilus assembly protein TadG